MGSVFGAIGFWGLWLIVVAAEVVGGGGKGQNGSWSAVVKGKE